VIRIWKACQENKNLEDINEDSREEFSQDLGSFFFAFSLASFASSRLNSSF